MKRFFVLFLSAALLLTGVFAASAQDVPCFLGGFTDETGTTCSYHAGIRIEIDYPQWINEHDFIRRSVQEFLTERRDEFWALGTSDLTTMFNPWFLEITYEEFGYSENVHSILFTIFDYMGGAHPNTYYKTFVFDTFAEYELSLDDLFTSTEDALAIIAPMVQDAVLERLGDDYTDLDWIESGSGTNPDNYQNFVLMQHSILFVFPPYQLAPYVAGSFEVTVLLDDLGDLVAPELEIWEE